MCRYALACLRHLAATQASQDVMLQCSSAVVSTLQTYVGTPAVAVHCLACIGHLATAAASLYVFVRVCMRVRVWKCVSVCVWRGVAWCGSSSPVWVVRLRRVELCAAVLAAGAKLSLPPPLPSRGMLHCCDFPFPMCFVPCPLSILANT